MSSKPKVLLGAEYSLLEPLALYYLASIAKSEGWDQKIVLGKSPQYSAWEEAIETFSPDVLGFSVYTGNHPRIADFIKRAKQKRPGLEVVIGGPHPTYFPKQSLEFADYVVVGEGLNSFRRILRRESPKGVLLPLIRENFPSCLREDFYNDSPAHRENRIKNVIANTGCPFNCSHCYNSGHIRDLGDFTPEEKLELKGIYPKGRFFPVSQRPLVDVLAELDDIRRVAPQTNFIFFEDDIFGINLPWLREFTKKYSASMPYHANMRFEHVDPNKDAGKERISLLKESGCTGVSFGVECSNPTICQEVLGRYSNTDLIFRVMHAMGNAGIKVRTYQMIGLPYGATTKPTPINLEADLDTLKLMVDLKAETGLPTFAWASTLAPYPGTQIARYCNKHGFYNGDFADLVGEETYRIRSVLRHPKEWTGSALSSQTASSWLPQDEQDRYRDQLSQLMNHFPLFAMIPNGHELARKFLDRTDHTSAGLNKALRTHIYDTELFN